MTALLAVTASRKGIVELTADTLTVRLGVTWHAEIPRSSIKAARKDPLKTISIGAHGWRGDWLVNTSTKGLVVLTIDPAASARCLGYPIKLRKLHVSLADPDAFLDALTSPTPA